MTTNVYKVINTSGGGGGSGTVEGPLVSTDNAIVRFDGVDGEVIQNSGVTIDDSNNVIVPGEVTIDGTAVKSTLDDHETRIDDLEAATGYIKTFNATTDWGAASGGFYTIVVAVGTHSKGTHPILQIQSLSGADYVDVEVDEIRTTAIGNVLIRVPESPDLRFEGRLIIN